MTNQGVGLVLGQYTDSAHTGVDAVGQGEIDDAHVAAEGNRRLGPLGGETTQSGAAASGQNQRQGVARHRADETLREMKAHPSGAIRPAGPCIRRARGSSFRCR